MTQIMFETFNVPFFHAKSDAILALHSCGRQTGIVIDSGEHITNIVPIYSGYAIKENIINLKIGGYDITKYLQTLLNNKGYNLTTTAERKLIVRDIKEKLCRISLNHDEEYKTNNIGKKYELPDGKVIEVNCERIECCESLFKPQLIRGESEINGIHKLIYESIIKCVCSIRNELYENIYLFGGNTMYPGISERLIKELIAMGCINSSLIEGYVRMYHNKQIRQFAIETIELMARFASTIPKVTAPRERKYSVWIGGSILASVSSFADKWISHAQYDEIGPTIVHRLCKNYV
eukprot:198117_1